MYLLKTCPAWRQIDVLIDHKLRTTPIFILSVGLLDMARTHACLPIERDGLGIRQTADVDLSALSVSTFAYFDLVAEILPSSMGIYRMDLTLETEAWK